MEINVDYDALKRTIDGTKIGEYHQTIEFEGIRFNVFECDIYGRNEPHGPAFWIGATYGADYDIYISIDVIKKEFRRAVLLHETLEAYVINKTQSKEISDEERYGMAHQIAAEYDNRYAGETLTEDEFREYLELRNQLTELRKNTRKL